MVILAAIKAKGWGLDKSEKICYIYFSLYDFNTAISLQTWGDEGLPMAVARFVDNFAKMSPVLNSVRLFV